MFGIQYYKADASTYVLKSTGGKIRKRGKGLSFYYNSAMTSIAAIPVSVREAPFIFSLQTSDFQQVKIQGQISFRVGEPEVIADMLNFTLEKDGKTYASEDPLKLSDRVVRAAQTVIQSKVQAVNLKQALNMNRQLVELLQSNLPQQPALSELGLVLVDISVATISPSPETSRALEAEARETILKEADDAIYARRKFAVEQERTIKDAELETELAVQKKEQEIEESRISNERSIMKAEAETEQERIRADIDAENQRKELVLLNAENSKQKADSEAYAVSVQMKALRELPVENLKAMALANMNPEQLMAVAFDSFAQNADKIGEFNITPDMFGQFMRRVRK